MKKLMLLFGFLTVAMACKNEAEDMAGSDLSGKPGTGMLNPNAPKSGKDPVNPRSETFYYFAGYQVSKTAGSDKMGMDIGKAPDNPTQLYVSGYSFVNMYGAGYTCDEKTGALKIKELIATEMAGSEEANKAEAEYFKNLQEATSIVFETQQVQIQVGNPVKEVMFFKKR
ncbi:META domain-containing protein [Emticicia fluvialis]|uniref:META domain-containing protein n=1 Tax=Emticicia fluvialis TaxID=2974474 RepID=UPI002165641F|nr:META domain-containing protein [Emticicia fluvialis]